MTPSTLIAFTGLAQAGKSTAASLFQSIGFELVSFAEPLKRMVKVLTDETYKHARPPELCGKSLREVYQSLGTEWGRGMVGTELWISYARRSILSHTNASRGVVLDDVRFDDEARLIHDLGGTVIRIERPGTVQLDHASENGVSPDLVDAVIVNAGTPVDLHNNLSEVWRSLFKTP